MVHGRIKIIFSVKTYKNRCENCSQKLEFDYTQAGKVTCPTCNGETVLRIPQPNKFVKFIKGAWAIITFCGYMTILGIGGLAKMIWNNLIGSAGVLFVSIGCGLAAISIVAPSLSFLAFLPIIGVSWIFGVVLLITSLSMELRNV